MAEASEDREPALLECAGRHGKETVSNSRASADVSRASLVSSVTLGPNHTVKECT